MLAASRHDLPVSDLARRAAADPFPARVVAAADLARFAAGARPITDESARPSPAPPPGLFARPLRPPDVAGDRHAEGEHAAEFVLPDGL